MQTEVMPFFFFAWCFVIWQYLANAISLSGGLEHEVVYWLQWIIAFPCSQRNHKHIWIAVEKTVCSTTSINVSLAKLEARIHIGKSTDHSRHTIKNKFCMTNLNYCRESQGIRPKLMSGFVRTLHSYSNAFIQNLASTEQELFKYLIEIEPISLFNLWIVP